MPRTSRSVRAPTTPHPEPAPDGSAMPTHYDTLPDIAIGRHPDYGIVAANPKQHTPNAWMLKSLDFHPVPDQPTLYALANQLQDGQGRTTRAVALLRRAGYEVDTDAAFDPSPTSCPTHARDRAPQVGPDVAFADLPELGVVAATGPRPPSWPADSFWRNTAGARTRAWASTRCPHP